ncbi:hypothetical protein Scep_025409 [Stephania cephalantha]|uniref:Uncharacterized protein n=1 Tax=Stephania cephalantha TaxID=152367 RepID=A0AAP0EI64_9MAGN
MALYRHLVLLLWTFLIGQSDLFRDEDFGANDLNLRSLMDQRGSSSDGSNLLQLMEFPSKTLWSKFSSCWSGCCSSSSTSELIPSSQSGLDHPPHHHQIAAADHHGRAS